jgi:cell division protein FtsN
LTAAAFVALVSFLLGNPAPAERSTSPRARPRSTVQRVARPLYRVHVGPYTERAEAAQVCAELNAHCIAAILLARETGFVVQVGAFRVRRSAQQIAEILAYSGLNVRVTEP